MAAAGFVGLFSIWQRSVMGQIAQYSGLSRAIDHTTRSVSENFERMGRAVELSERQMASFARIAAVSGGTMAQAGRAGGALGLAGEDPASVAARARSLRERLATSPYAQAAFGTFTLPAGTGQLINEARLFNEVSRQIIFGRSAEAARMKAQIAGLEELLPLRNADRQLTEEALNLAERRAAFVSAESRRDLANLNALRYANREREGIFRDSATRLFVPFMEGLERVKATNLDVWGAVARAAEAAGKKAGGWSSVFERMSPFLAVMDTLFGLRDRAPAKKDPQAELAERIVDLAHEMSMWRREMAGGGPRARAAVPPGLRGMALEEGLRARALRLGAWEL
jgi:hypothetical protein